MSILDSLRPPPDLRVLVTCGAGGIGAVIARAFHEAGSRVHVCDIDRAALDRLNTEVPGITGSMADASVADDVDLVFDDVQGTLGGLDVLINNAGIRGPAGPIDTIGGAAWERTVAVNLHSHYYFARRAVPMLRRSGTSPRLIAMGSVAGPHDGAYRAARASTRWPSSAWSRRSRASSGATGSASTRSCPARSTVRRDWRRRRPVRMALRRLPPFAKDRAVAA